MRTVGSWALGGAVGAVLASGGCEGQGRPAPEPRYSRSLAEVAASQHASPEELATDRQDAGFQRHEAALAEARARYEKTSREYIKTRIGEYRALVDGLAAMLGDVEAAAPKWRSPKDFDKFASKLKDRNKAFREDYDKLTKRGSAGGDAQVSLAQLVRRWDELHSGLEPGVADQPRFASLVEELRLELASFRAVLDEIADDPELAVDPTYVPPAPAGAKRPRTPGRAKP